MLSSLLSTWSRNKITLFLLIVFVNIYMIVIMSWLKEHRSNNPVKANYLVFSSHCRIPNFDPYDTSIKNQLRPPPSVPCPTRPPLTYTARVDGRQMLVVNKAVTKVYLNNTRMPRCCYEVVTRISESENRISECKIFIDKVLLDPHEEYLSVECADPQTAKLVYRNVHAVVHDKPSLRRRHPEQLSVSIVGIDSMSRLNAIRTMPRTLARLRADSWVELRGYNKIGYNTLPNLLAILNGADSQRISEHCPDERRLFDDCPFVWDEFKRRGYVTAFAEDEPQISMFNFHKNGFTKQPTDFYFRTFTLEAMNRLHKINHERLAVCLGHESTTDQFLRFNLDVATTFNDSLYFSLIWLNNFSHSSQFIPEGVDESFASYFDQLKRNGVLDTTMVFFLSDHGNRFEGTRATQLGWLEERLPLAYISIPDALKVTRPRLYANLQANSDRLSSPYDLHMTLTDVLGGFRSAGSATKGCPGCPNCASLFSALPRERSCSDAGIPDEWCSCVELTANVDSSVVLKGANLIVDKIRESLSKDQNKNCARTFLNRVITAFTKLPMNKTELSDYVDHVIVIETNEKLIVEATVQESRGDVNDSLLEIVGQINRLDRITEYPWCVDYTMQLFCSCLVKNKTLE